MSPRRGDDNEKEDWRDVRSRDIERFGIYIIGGLIVLVSTLGGFVLHDIRQTGLTNQLLQTGNAAAINILETKFDNHVQSHKIIWTEEEKAEYYKIREALYRKWEFLSSTRGGEETLLKQPIGEGLQ